MYEKDINELIKELALRSKELELSLDFSQKEWKEFLKLMGLEEEKKDE
jgi:hypothetical protein